MSTGNFKHDLFSQFARVAKAMSNGYRLELLEFLAQGERSVDALAQASGLTVANTSQHLHQLRQTGLVTNRKEGHRVYYRLSGMDVAALLGSLREVAERRLADVDRLVNDYLKTKDSLEPVPANELLERARDGLITVLDVRPSEEYLSGHLPGAINIPLDELEKHLDELNPDPSSTRPTLVCRALPANRVYDRFVTCCLFNHYQMFTTVSYHCWPLVGKNG